MFITAPSYAASKCPDFYPHGIPIEVPNTVELCNSFFVTVYDTHRKANIFSSEKFVAPHTDLNRVDSFRPDKRLPKESRAALGDYLNNIWDRGNMVPSDDASTPTEMRDTFLLSNMTPQSSVLNKGEWKNLELAIRKKANGTTRVITGAIYVSAPKTMGTNNIPIPVKYYKCVWYTEKDVECFVAKNKNSAQVIMVTTQAVSKLSGILIK